MDPPPEGCPLCGSTWGDFWLDVDGRSTFFCCALCATQWLTVREEVRRRRGWTTIDAIEVDGSRWGRTMTASSGPSRFAFFVAFTPEGLLRRFEERTLPGVEVPAAPAEPSERSAPGPGAPTGLNPKLRERLESEAERFLDPTSMAIDEARGQLREIVAETDALAGGAPAVALIKNSTIPLEGRRLTARLYYPDAGDPPYAALLYLHGGGFVFGDLDTADSLCREIANRSGCVVASVAYRRPPEHRFPEAVDDAYGALEWLSSAKVAERLRLDPGRIAVGGDDAGGNLAAVVARIARDEAGPRLGGQLLLYPITSYRAETASARENAEGMGLEGTFLPWMWEQYLRSSEDAKDPRAVPSLVDDLSRLPPALVVTAECDILRDEGEEYAARLRAAGVEVEAARYAGMIHGFLDYRGAVADGWKALDRVGDWLRRTLGGAPASAPAASGPAASDSSPPAPTFPDGQAEPPRSDAPP